MGKGEEGVVVEERTSSFIAGIKGFHRGHQRDSLIIEGGGSRPVRTAYYKFRFLFQIFLASRHISHSIVHTIKEGKIAGDGIKCFQS
jgi:hypothetical protein